MTYDEVINHTLERITSLRATLAKSATDTRRHVAR
jgi:hypothetical protein